MSLDFSKQVFKDLEIDLHDSRRQLEHILDLIKVGSLPNDQEILQLHSSMIKMLSDVTEYYGYHINNFNGIEEIDIHPPVTNVVQFPKNNKDKD